MQSAVSTYRAHLAETLPGEQTEVLVEVEEVLETPWRLILYNDEIHTFDEVINQLVKAIKCSFNKAEEIAFRVHFEGKALVFEGAFEECLRINSILMEIQLVTEIKG